MKMTLGCVEEMTEEGSKLSPSSFSSRSHSTHQAARLTDKNLLQNYKTAVEGDRDTCMRFVH